MHHDDLVPYAAKLNCVADFKLVALPRLKVVILIIAHVSHDEPELVARIRLLVVCIVDFKTMVYPIIIVFKHAGRRYLLLGELLFQAFVVERGGAELIEGLRINRIIMSLEHDYKNKNGLMNV